MNKLWIDVAGLLLSMSARAELVTFEYTGMVNFIREWPVNQQYTHARALAASTIAPGTIRVGHTFSGTLTYDTAMNRWNMGDPALEGYYSDLGNGRYVPSSTIRFDQAGWQLLTRPQSPLITVFDLGTDYASISYALAPNGNLWFSLSSGIDALNGPAIPSDIDLARFDEPFVTLTWTNDQASATLETRGMLTSLTRVAPVPEPSTYLLLAAGLAVVAGGARRRAARLNVSPT